MKKVISLLLTAVILFTSFNLVIFSSLALDPGIMKPGDADTITVSDNPSYALGNGTDNNLCVVENGSFESDFAEVNGGVCASKVFTTWRWFVGNSSFYSYISAGNYVYCPNPNAADAIPQIIYSMSEKSILKFRLGLRADAAEWSDFKIEYSEDGNEYSEVKLSDVTYTTEAFVADAPYYKGDKAGQLHTVYVRSYDILMNNPGFIKISLPNAQIIKKNTVEKGLNSSDYALIGSSAFLIPATASQVDADRLEAGDSDSITVNTSAQPLCADEGRLAYAKTNVTSIATVSDGVSVVLVDDNWRWLYGQSKFYTEVTPVDSWVYSINPWNAHNLPTVTYKVTGGTKVCFKVVIRDKAASFGDVDIAYSVNGDIFESLSADKLTYSEKVYSADISAMRVRSYQVYIPKDNGFLRISLPTAANVMNAIIDNSLNSDRESIVYSSAMVIPASCEHSNKVLSAGTNDTITVAKDATVIAGSFTNESLCAVGSSDVGTEYARINGGIAATKVFSTWRWFRGDSEFYNDVIPASTPDKTNWLYSVNPSYLDGAPSVQYDVQSDTEVSLMIGIRKDTADWNDVKFSFSSDSSDFNTEALSSVYISESYVCEDTWYSGGNKVGSKHEVEVRKYVISIPEDGTLKIELPTGVTVKDNILNNSLNSDAYSLVYSSVFMLPASCAEKGTNIGLYSRENQYVAAVGKKLITLTDDVSVNELLNYVEFKNISKDDFTLQYLKENGSPFADKDAPIPSGCQLNIIGPDGTTIKTYLFERRYYSKRLMTIGSTDSLNWNNAPHYYNSDGKLVVTSQYLANSGLEYATISGPIVVKPTGSWIFSPYFTFGVGDKVWTTIYAMGDWSRNAAERPSISWKVAKRSEIQIPIMLPSDCSKFFSEFDFLISYDGENYEKVPSHLLEYTQATRKYNNWGEAYIRTYSVHMIEEGYVKVVFPKFSRMETEISKINSGIDFIETVASIAPPTVVKSSKDSSVSLGDTDSNFKIKIDEDNKKIDVMCLIKDNPTVGDLLNKLVLNYAYGKATDASGNEIPYSTPLSSSLKLSVYTRGNIFVPDDTYFSDYDVSITKVEKFYVPEISAKDESVIINHNDNTISISYTIYETVTYEELLSMINFSHCTYKLVTVADVSYTNTAASVGSSPVFLKIYTNGCPGIEDGTLYETYEILGEILKADRVFKSRDTSVIYIDEPTKVIYYKNDLTIGQMKQGLIMINTSISFFDSDDNELFGENTVLNKDMTVSTTYGATALYYTLQPMTVLITPASKSTSTTRHYKVIEGYDSDMKMIVTVSVIAGAVVLLVIAAIIVLIVVKHKKRGRDWVK